MLLTVGIIWFIGALLCAWLAGNANEEWEGANVAISILWPLVLILVLIVGPFYLVHKLGKKAAERRQRKEEEKASANEDFT